ncbi:MAG: right-handed parallel beta-helix repeat-containing protein, partial [Candidatus Delongbacteria bacterium]|nr:right-handed parallel beta-helix repeat-containing protein [Candidatus Delongbacteria bacterium]
MRSSILAVLLLVNIIFAGNVLFEDFESEDFLSNNWVHSGDADWIIDSVITYNGDFSACSGDIGNNSTTVLILDSIFISENNESKISFYKKISTEISYDYFKFYINDNVIDSCSGNIDWSYNEYYFNTTGNHTFKFEYIKDISDDGGSDQVWLDNITINEFIQAPAFSIPEGSYSNDMVLELTSIYENANTYYTNNGTDPDSTSIPYDPASGIEVSGDSGYVTIKAVLYNIAGENSLVAANTYYMGSELSGSISGNVGKGDYYVMGDLLVEDQTTLTIEPGVKMYFTGCYGIDVQGQIIAEGTKDDSITFTYKNSENEDGWGIHNLSLNALCGIYINGTTDISKFEYCKIEKTQNVAISTRSSILSIKNCLVSSFENGVVGFNNSGELDILNSTIINCKGLGVKAYFGCELSLIGNVISHNEGGLLIGASNSYVTNNTIANNYIATGFSNSVSGIIVSSNTVVTNDFTNNLIYNNETTGSISQIWVDGTNCHPNFRHNNIEGGRSGIIGSASINIYENNLDIDPKFTNDTIHPYSLQNISPCANMGMSDIADITLPPNDIAGNTRIFQDIIDIGAYELQETTETKPELELSETTFYFGEVEWGNSEERTLFIENNGNASLELDIFVKDTSDVFTIVKGLKQTKTDTLHFEIPPFGSESLIVTFTPSDDITSVYNGEIEFSSNDKDGSIALVGKGSGYPDLVISNITIPDPEVEIIAGTSIEVSWTIENIGNTETSVIGGWKDYVTLVKIIDSENIKRIITKDDDNISALRPGETYTNTSRFDIPITNEVEGIYRFDISTAMDCINFENRDNNDLSSSNFE